MRLNLRRNFVLLVYHIKQYKIKKRINSMNIMNSKWNHPIIMWPPSTNLRLWAYGEVNRSKKLSKHELVLICQMKHSKRTLTIMHVTVAFRGLQLNGLEEVLLCFCFLPLGEKESKQYDYYFNHSSKLLIMKIPYSAQRPKHHNVYLMPSPPQPQTYLNDKS